MSVKRIAILLIGAVVVVAAAGAIWAYRHVSDLRVERVTDAVHVIRGVGGNVGVLRTDEGPVVVDTMMFRMQGERIREKAEEIGGGPIQMVINTHYHLDHTHGNPAFPAGMRTLATRRTREHLLELDAGYWDGANRAHLPNELIGEGVREISLGGRTIRLLHPGRGHTDGDLVVLFVEDRVLHAGDLLFHQQFPNIDLEAGGSVPAWIDTLDRILALDFERVIAGHGEATDRDGLRAFQAFLRELWREVQASVAAGRSLEQTLASVELPSSEGYSPAGFPPVYTIDRDFVIRRAYEEASRAAGTAAVGDGR